MQESLAGIHVVKAYTLEDHEAALSAKQTTITTNRDWRSRGSAAAMFPMIRGTSTVAVMVLLIYGGSMVTRQKLEIGDLVAFMGYLDAAGVAGHLAGLR